MADEDTNLLIRKKGRSAKSSINSDHSGILESPVVASPINIPLEPDMEGSLISGDRSSVLFTLERAVEILKSQMDQEERQIRMRLDF